MLDYIKKLFSCSGDYRSKTNQIQDWSGISVDFDYFNPSAKEIYIAGDFNNWSTSSDKMTRDKTGRFKIRIRLSPGRYQYKFLVDGRWMVDQKPTTLIDNPFGTKNSVIDI